MTHKIRRFILWLLASMMAASCESTAPTQPAGAIRPAEVGQLTGSTAALSPDDGQCPDGPGPISGPIVFGENGNLLAIGVDGSGLQQLTNLPQTSWVQYPTWSPDGQTLTFTLNVPGGEGDLSWLQQTSICAMDRATGKSRTLVAGRGTQEALSDAAWTPDGQALLVVVTHHQIDDKNQYLGATTEIARYDLSSGQLTPLLADASNPVPSPDGKRLAYVHGDPETGALSLMLAQADGQQGQPVRSPGKPFVTTSAPAWSPNGQTLVFAASASVGSVPAPSSVVRVLLDRLLGVSVAEAHGLPADLWVLKANGQGARQVTTAGFDDPRAVWSPDGQRLAVITNGGGVRMIDVGTGAERQLTQRGDSGGIAWAQR